MPGVMGSPGGPVARGPQGPPGPPGAPGMASPDAEMGSTADSAQDTDFSLRSNFPEAWIWLDTYTG